MAIRNLLLLLTFSLHCLSCFSKEGDDPFANFLVKRPFSMVAGEEGDAASSLERRSMERLDGSVDRTRFKRVVNVEKYGAKGDGTEDNEAFEKAWQEACSSESSVVLLVPAYKTYLLQPMNFSGPCRSDVTVNIEGTLVAPSNPSDWNGGELWISFIDIRNLAVGGGGILDGKGKVWWEKSCKLNKTQPCTNRATALFFHSCDGLRLENLKIKDSQQIQVFINHCKQVIVSRLTITAPSWSPNTDGIHVAKSENVLITKSFIGTGDDCISIVDGSHKVVATEILCGPGHGISIGSLGAGKSEDRVSRVLVGNVSFKNTTNGARIKTWQGGHGYAKYIIFQNMEMHNVHNPIIIDQNYCDSLNPCHEQESAVAVSHVLYKNIKGTSSSEEGMNFNCSRSTWCKHIVLEDISIKGYGEGTTKCLHSNIDFIKVGDVFPFCD